MKTIEVNKLADQLANELYIHAIDWRSEISNHDIMYKKDTFKILDDFGQKKFEDLVIYKIEQLQKKEEENFNNIVNKIKEIA